MNKKSKIALITIFSIIAIVYATYLFIIPNLIDLNRFKPEIQKAVKEATGLEVDLGRLKLHTYYDFSAKLTTENVKVDKYLTVDNASVRVLLVPLLFKKLEIEEIRVDKPEAFITRQKDSKYDIEKVIEDINKKHDAAKSSDANESNPEKAKSKGIEPVFDGMKLYVSDYKINLTDFSGGKERHFALKGDIFEIPKIKKHKFIKLATKGSLLVENKPNINFDIKFASVLPIKIPDEVWGPEYLKLTEEQKAQLQAEMLKRFDPIKNIIKYDPTTDIIADLKLKPGEKLPEVKGFLNFDKLSLKVDGQKLPASYGKFNFSGKNIDINSKLFITSDSFLEVIGNIKDLLKQDFNLNVKTTDIELKNVKKFMYSFAELANADMKTLNLPDMAGKIKADFNLQKNNYKGYLNITNASVFTKDLSQPLKEFNSTLNFNKDKVELIKTSGKLADIGFNAAGNINSKLFSDIKISIPNVNLKTVYSILNNSKLFADLKPQLKDLSAVDGKVSVEVFVKGQLDKKITPIINATIHKASAYHAPSKNPISIEGGSVRVDDKGKVAFKNIKTMLAKIPLDINGQFEGDANNWNLSAETPISNVEFINGLNTLKINATGSPKSVYISKTALYSGTKELVSVDGSINNNILNDVKVTISGLNLNIKEPKGKVQVSGNLVVNGKTNAPKALGTLSLTNLDIPSLSLRTNDVNVTLKSDAILLTTGVLNMEDSRIKLDAVLENKLAPPFVVKALEINSDFMNVDRLSKALEQKPVNSAGQQRGSSSAQAGKSKDQDVPVIVNSGRFFAKQLIVNKLLNNDVSFNFTINPVNMLNIRNLSTNIAGGTATGKADMNLKTTKLNVDLDANNIEINALASELANMRDQIFGGMKGHIQLSTIGKTPELMTQNAVGKANFTITNGYLGPLGDITYLFKLVALKFGEQDKTNHFDTLKGLVLINRGMLEVQDITVQGKRLSSFMSGTVRMKDNYADLTVLGKLSGKIVSQLGPVADLSINKLTKKIPGQWGQLLTEVLPIGKYPNRHRIPALNAEPLENDKDFAVKLKGTLGKPTSMRMFEWLE